MTPATRFAMLLGAAIVPLIVGACASITPHAAPSHVAAPRWTPIGRSAQGRPITALTIGAGPRRVLLIAGIHGDEPEGLLVIDTLVDALLEMHRTGLLDGCTIRVVRDANPDGTAARTRANARGVDLNRNWPASNFAPGADRGPHPLSEPEARALHRELSARPPDLVIVFHSSTRGPFVNFDGPGHDLAHVFAHAAEASDPRWRVVGSIGYPTPGSLGSWIGVDRGVAILTIEFERGGGPAPQAAAAGLRAVSRTIRLSSS